MFRISKAEGPTYTTITIDGQLSGGCIEVVEGFCEKEISAGIPIHLFLRDLTSMDRAGRALLERLAAKGVRLRASGVYTTYIVDELISKRAGNGCPSR